MKYIKSVFFMCLFSGCGISDGPSLNMSPSVPVPCAIENLKLSTNQAASLVIGQADFTTHAWASTTATSLKAAGPIGAFHGLLLVSDYHSNRILGFNSIPSTSGPTADFIIGQNSTTANGSGVSDIAFNGPEGISFTGTGQMAVADVSNNRVLIYNTPPLAAGAIADVVVGQPDFSTHASNVCTQSSLYSPESVFIGHGKLLVADESNSRIMIWNSIPTTNGAPADLVLGQTDFTHCNSNGGGSVSASVVNAAQDVWTDGTKLIVADGDNNRVLIWNTFPTVNNQPADIILGQTTGTGNTPNAGVGSVNQLGMDGSYFVDSNGTQVVVAEQNNSRVLVWNTFPTTTGQLPDVVLGQTGFGNNGTGFTSTEMNTAYGVRICGKQLFVSDGGNNRYLIFNGQ